MTPEDFKARRLALGYHQHELGRAIGVFERTIRRYERGEAQIPPPVALLMGYLTGDKLEHQLRALNEAAYAAAKTARKTDSPLTSRLVALALETDNLIDGRN